MELRAFRESTGSAEEPLGRLATLEEVLEAEIYCYAESASASLTYFGAYHIMRTIKIHIDRP